MCHFKDLFYFISNPSYWFNQLYINSSNHEQVKCNNKQGKKWQDNTAVQASLVD